MSVKYSLYKKINVIGPSGSGKSTLAKEISNTLSIEYIEMDKLFWKANWKESTKEEFLNNLEDALAGESWVLDGNYTSAIPVKWKRSELIVWIDLPFHLVFWQALCRAIKRIVSKKELWAETGNIETFKRTFLSKDSILLWTIQTYPKVKKRFESYMNDKKYSHLFFVRLKSRKETREFIKSLEEKGRK
jgi:adenylate kinase family enzyme